MGIGLVFMMAGLTLVATFFFIFSGDLWIAIFISVIINMMLFLVLAMISWKTPAGAFMTAFMKKMSILELTTKDRRKRFIPVHVQNKMIRLKKRGESYIVTENSVYNELNSGLPIMEANADYGVTVAPMHMQHCMGMKEMGFENIGEVENTVFCKACDKLIVPLAKKDREAGMIIKCPDCEKQSDTSQDNFDVNYEISYPMNTTIRVHDMAGFLKYNLSPSIVDIQIEKSVALALEEATKFNAMTMAKIAGIGLAVMCIAIAYVIVTQQTGAACPACPDCVSMVKAVCGQTASIGG